ncbi:PREDICTED: olfactory receptor 10W1-like [Miniopterus natalensis]|uniref:olfactory receptor 10W1-like n=1 Tax=Miniopterus natalensis TaxID=291302 RepID=UPI0007A6B0BB|nr:PREDICTED: olfactory receptor 10W1-like [Miniopterus natalensis]
MPGGNGSVWVEFVFLAYPCRPELRALSFLGVGLLYALTVGGHVLVVAAIQADARLHTPMYCLLGSLSGVEVCYTATVVPHMLANLLQPQKTISLPSCATQMAFFIGLGSADCFLLVVMAYDRYVAICHPLRYPLIMTLTLCVRLVVASTLIGLVLSSQLVAFIFSLPFCQARGIEHFFCDVPPVMRLVCANSHSHERSVLAAATLAIAVPFCVIATSYGFIVAAVAKLRSAGGRRRAFSTCCSHLAVVLLQYGCCALTYLRPDSGCSPGQGQLISLVYTLGTPLLNPLIYTLRNSEVKGAIGRVLPRSCLRQGRARPIGKGLAPPHANPGAPKIPLG